MGVGEDCQGRGRDGVSGLKIGEKKENGKNTMFIERNARKAIMKQNRTREKERLLVCNTVIPGEAFKKV